MRNKIMGAAAAVSLIVTPTLASAQQAAPAETAPAVEQVEGSQIRGGFILPLVAIIALAILIYLLTKNNDDDGLPTSP